MNKIGLMDVKSALKDARFRKNLPPELNDDVVKYLNNPGCPTCGVPLFRKILKHCKQQLRDYFPGQDVVDEEKELAKLAENHWTVINCSVDELEDQLRKLPPGRKQIDVARYEDQVTVVVNEIDILY